MIANVKARYSKGVLTPLEPLDLEEGKEVLVSIEDAHTTGQWGGDHPRDVPEAQEFRARRTPGTTCPPTLLRTKKHYLYGHPKEDD